MGTTATARASALLLTVGLLLAGCSDDGDKPTPAASAPTLAAAPSPAPSVDCADPSLSMGDWTAHCQGASPQTPSAPELLQLGQSARTAGDRTTGGLLEIAPTTVVYRTGQEAGTVSDKDGYVTVLLKATNPGTTPVDQASRGWAYIAPDGEALTTGVLIPSSIKPLDGRVPAGSFLVGAEHWEIRTAQRGGTLQYTDGAGVVYRWQLPAQDTGPQVAEVRKS